jgi:hypothetical protein
MLAFSSLPMLALLPVVIAGLWYAYKRMGQAQRVNVGTSFYIKKLVGAASLRRRFIPPWRFLIELISLLLLVLAAAGVVLSKDAKRVLIVIDDSRSMSAELDGESLLSVAMSRAGAMLAGAEGAFPSLILTSYPDSLVTGSDVASIFRRLDVKAVDVEDGLELLVPRLLATQRYEELWVFTDKELADLPENVKAPPLFRRDSAPQNIGILGISQNGRNLRASLFRTGPGTETVKIGLRRLVSGKFEQVFSGKAVKILDSADVDLGPIPDYPVEISITATLGGNSIKSDDVAWALPESTKIFRVHGDVAPETLKIDGYRFVAATEGNSSIQRDIFYKIDGVGAGNALYVLAPSSIAAGGLVRREALSNWQVDSPLLKYLFSPDLSDIPFLPLSPEVADDVLAAGASGAMLAVKRSEHRNIYTGFDLFPFDSKNVAKSILTLNILNWLSEASQLQNGAVLKTNAKYSTLSGAQVLPPINSGLYLVSDGVERLSAINLFSAAESQVGLKSALGKSAAAIKDKGVVPTGFELWRIIVYLVLSLAVLDLLFSVVRRRRA